MDLFPTDYEPLFRKSNYSTAAANCVEIAGLPAGQHAVRDSQNRHLGGFLFPTQAWGAFLASVKTGEFDA